MIPFIDLHAQRRRLGRQIPEAIDRVLQHGGFIDGPEVTALETALSQRCGDVQVVGVASGTAALLLAFLALKIGPGDAVIVPSFTFAATAEAVARVGATPVFADSDEDTYGIDVVSTAAAVASAERLGLRPRAIVPVDLFGQPVSYKTLTEFASRHDMAVVADAAQSLGATLSGEPVGTLGTMTATSFFPGKPLGCYGDGGAVMTSNDHLASMVRSLRVHGQGVDKYDNVRIGINGRLDTIQAAILLEKLTIFDSEIKLRQQVAQRYTDLLAEVVTTPRVDAAATSVWAQYTVQLDRRDEVARALKAEGIPTGIYYRRPLHLQSAYRSYPTAPGLAVCERLAGRVLSLPMHPYLDEGTQERIAGAVVRAVRS